MIDFVLVFCSIQVDFKNCSSTCDSFEFFICCPSVTLRSRKLLSRSFIHSFFEVKNVLDQVKDIICVLD